MSDELVKRTNPFEKKKEQFDDLESVEEVEEQKSTIDDDYEEVQQPKKVSRPSYVQPKASKPTRQTKYVEEESAYKEKYTSTMDVDLRRTIKIVCATRGIMFGQFIEDACREKLQREGTK